MLAAITIARIKAGIDAQNAGGLTGLVGGSTSTAPTGFSWSAPDTIMAFLMLGVLVTSGAISFIVAWLTTRPLLSAAEKAHAHADKLRLYRDQLLGEAVQAREATQQSLRLDHEDAVRYTGARITFAARVDLLRAQLATRLAQHERDPESTSQIIRELRARRAVELPATRDPRGRAERAAVAADRLNRPAGRPPAPGPKGPDVIIPSIARAGLAIAAVLALGGGLTACASATAAGAACDQSQKRNMGVVAGSTANAPAVDPARRPRSTSSQPSARATAA